MGPSPHRPPPPAAGPGERERRTVALAKTTRPNTAALVMREKLFDRMDAGADRTVVWITAPAGAGKTSLAASYVAARDRRCLWYEFDPDDEDESTFFHYFATAAAKHLLATGIARPATTSDASADAARSARAFFRSIHASAQPPWVIVFDGYAPSSAASALHALLDAALQQVPPGGLVIVTSREPPPASCARLRLAGRMTVLDAGQLQLDAGEIQSIASLRGQPLAQDVARDLQQGVGGWAAALVLVLEHAKLSGQLPQLPVSSPPQVLFDYLAGEVFERFEPRMREFLLRCACMKRMTPALAEAVSGESRATRLLLNLASNHYFVNDASWDGTHGFQFHPLLRDFLLHRAQLDLPEAVAPHHLRRAARCLREAGHTEDAVALLMDCGDWAGLAQVAVQDAASMLGQGRADALATWIEALPAAELDRTPALRLALGRCRLAQGPRGARRQFELAAQSLAQAQDAEAERLACRGVIECLLLELDDLAASERWLDRLAGLPVPVAKQDAEELGVLAALVRNGSPGRHGRLGRDAAPARWMPVLAAVLEGEGAVPDAGPQASHAERLARALGQFLAGDFEAVLADEAIAATAANAGADGLWSRVLRSAAALAQGDRERAVVCCRWLHGADPAAAGGERAVRAFLRAWLSALEGDALAAARGYRAAAGAAEEAGMAWLQGLAGLGAAGAHAAIGDTRAARSHLRGVAHLPLTAPWWLFAHGVWTAAVEQAESPLPSASPPPSLAGAFAIGRLHGIEWAPGWTREQAARLCATALQSGVEADFARHLVRRHALTPREAPLAAVDWPWPVRVRTLGAFAIELDGRPLEPTGKGPGRPAELLKVLLSLGGQGVRIHLLADALWPHADADYAHKSFTAALHRLRRLLGSDAALVLRDARLGIDAAVVWTDAGMLDSLLQQLDAALRPGVPADAAVVAALLEQVLALYRGPFLGDDTDQPVYVAFREQLRARLLRHLAAASRVFEADGQFDAAIDAHLRLIDADPLFEAAYRHLMLCHQRRGDRHAGREVYERLRTTLSMRLRTMPSAQSQELFATLSAG